MTRFESKEQDLEKLWSAAQHADLHPLAREQIEELIRLTQVERQLRRTRADQLFSIEALAAKALDSPETAWRWLRERQVTLDAIPLDLIARSEPAAREVKALLHRIEYGNYG